ncbi:hypothetical protein HAX54_009682 [Datura stramonium]|uniref:Uncharacterized protein n=1 Tax=Datura stramonium TaxID=4076 RepID=A0ABS8WXK9_DATST|nr:hypothetical protein [Datura stramonium]
MKMKQSIHPRSWASSKLPSKNSLRVPPCARIIKLSPKEYILGKTLPTFPFVVAMPVTRAVEADFKEEPDMSRGDEDQQARGGMTRICRVNKREL